MRKQCYWLIIQMHPSKFSIEGLELVKDKLTTPDQFTYKEDGDVQAPVCTPKI